MSQPTPPFLLFLPALHLTLLSSLIILPHLLPEPGSIKEGENPALVFTSTHAVSHAVSLFHVYLFNCSNLLLTVFSMLLCEAPFRWRNAKRFTHWLTVWKMIQTVSLQKLNYFQLFSLSLCEQGLSFSFYLFSASFFHLHLSISVLWVVCVPVSTPPPLSLIFWNFNFWPLSKRTIVLSQGAGTHTYTPNNDLRVSSIVLICAPCYIDHFNWFMCLFFDIYECVCAMTY